jgi:hypothetical protein
MRWIEAEDLDVLPDLYRPLLLPIAKQLLEEILAAGKMVVETSPADSELPGEAVYADSDMP